MRTSEAYYCYNPIPCEAMNKKEIFRKIGGIISELTEQYQYLSENIDDINDLELELFMANSKFLSDHIEILRKLNVASSTDKTPQAIVLPTLQESVRITLKEEDELQKGFSEEPNREPLQVERVTEGPVDVQGFPARADRPELGEREPVEPTNSDGAQSSQLTDSEAENISYNNTFEEAAKIEVPESVRELESFRKVENDEEPATGQIPSEAFDGDAFRDAEATDLSNNNTFEQAATIEVPERVQELKSFPQEMETEVREPEPESVAPTQTGTPAHVPTINDLISAQRKPLVEPASFNKKPVTDLKAGINLNDKLLFIKDLFNGYSLAYSEAIELLNRFDSFDAASKFLKANYAEKNNWVAKQSSADKFYEILERRFTK